MTARTPPPQNYVHFETEPKESNKTDNSKLIDYNGTNTNKASINQSSVGGKNTNTSTNEQKSYYAKPVENYSSLFDTEIVYLPRKRTEPKKEEPKEVPQETKSSKAADENVNRNISDYGNTRRESYTALERSVRDTRDRVQQVDDKVEALDSNWKTVPHRVGEAETTMVSKGNRVDELEWRNKLHSAKIHDLENELRNVKIENSRIKGQLGGHTLGAPIPEESNTYRNGYNDRDGPHNGSSPRFEPQQQVYPGAREMAQRQGPPQPGAKGPPGRQYENEQHRIAHRVGGPDEEPYWGFNYYDPQFVTAYRREHIPYYANLEEREKSNSSRGYHERKLLNNTDITKMSYDTNRRRCNVCKLQSCSQTEEVCWNCKYSRSGISDITETPTTEKGSFVLRTRRSLEEKYSANKLTTPVNRQMQERTADPGAETAIPMTKSTQTTSNAMVNESFANWENATSNNNKDSSSQSVPRRTDSFDSGYHLRASKTGSGRTTQGYLRKPEEKYDTHSNNNSETTIYTRKANTQEAFTDDEEVKKVIKDVYVGSDQFFDGITIVCSHNDRQKLDINQRYGRLSIFKKPEILIYSDESNKLAIREEALDQISGIENPLNIVAISGLYKTGKSYLMNQLADEKNGFAIGHKVSSETKGIWAWCKQHPTQKDQVLLLLDVEGMADVNKGDRDYDNRLFCLANLICSTLIYNHLGVFNQDALEKMSFITRLSKTVRATHDLSDVANDETIRLLSPTFVICLRDFHLDLEDDNEAFQDADAYFEKVINISLGPEKTSNFETKECIHKYYPKRKCVTISQPAMNKKLSMLHMLKKEDLDKEFLLEVENLKKFVYECKPKVLDAVTRKVANGPVFETFVRTYVRALAVGDKMTFTEALEQSSALHNGMLVVKVVREYREEIDNIKLPVKKKREIQDMCIKTQKKKLEKFRNESYPLLNDEFEENAMKKMTNIQTKKMEENCEIVQSVLSDILRGIYRNKIESCKEKYDSKHGVTLYKKDVNNVKNTFEEKAKGFDPDDISTAFLKFKKDTIYDEMWRVEMAAEIRKEQIRNEELRKQMQEGQNTQLRKEIEEIKREKAIALDKQLREMQENYEKAMGREAVKGKKFWKKMKLLFGS